MLLVHDIIGGTYAMSIQSGAKIYDLILPLLQQGEEVVLDFTGVEVCAPPFLNYAIGALLKDFSEEEVRAKVKCVNMNDLAHETLEDILEINAEYFTDPVFREAVDSIRTRMLQDTDDW